jgi:hypothetical protein
MAQFTSPLLTNSTGQKPEIPTPSAGDILEDRIKIGASASSFGGDNNKYKISNLMYPDNLMDESNAGSYGVFYLNVNVDSKLLRDKSNYTIDDTSVPARQRGLALDSGVDNTAGGVAATAGLYGGIIGAAGGAVGFGAALKGAATGGAAGALGVGVVSTQTSTFSRAQKRLASAIALHVPNQLVARYSTQWESEDTDLFNMVKEGGESIVNAVTGAGKAGALSGSAANIGTALGLRGIAGVKVPEAVQGLAGIAPNPRKEQFFKGVDFRTFTFDYRFSPRNEREAKNVQNIIYLFKLHMHPEFKDDGTFLYVYPSEFDISYFHNHEENLNIHRHTSCVLTDMAIQYVPNSQYNTFSNGMSTQVDVQLTFKELAIITKETIQKGL